MWTDPQSGLEIRCEAIEYHDFPTVEWTFYLKNTADAVEPLRARTPHGSFFAGAASA
jgi:alpha-galactosidase